MKSALYFGRLRHRRYQPRRHAFGYRLCMVWLDLAELGEVFHGRWFWSARRPTLAWLRRSDFLGDPAVSLDQAVRNLVERETGVRPCGSIRLLTRLRSLGEGFNPVSFYYCYDACGERIETILAEITNTPWNERHTYVLSARDSRSDGKHLCFSFDKRFHVSPFMPMDIDYDWRFSRPDERIVVHMENRRRSELLFDATLTLTRNEINGKNLAIALAIHQWTRLLVLAAIHWQALRLWCKRVPYFTHPGKRAEEKAR